jgi:hypothetical protein
MSDERRTCGDGHRSMVCGTPSTESRYAARERHDVLLLLRQTPRSAPIHTEDRRKEPEAMNVGQTSNRGAKSVLSVGMRVRRSIFLA